MIERFKNIFTGLERAHGVTIAEDTNGNGTKIKGKSFVKRQPVTDELWQKHLDGKENLGVKFYLGESVIKINTDGKVVKSVNTKSNTYASDILIGSADYHHIENK